MIIDWPTSLPQRVKFGGKAVLNAKKNRLRTDFDYGNIRMRRQFVNQPSYEHGTISFKDIEIEIFNGFVMSTLKDGTRFFWFNIPIGNSMVPHRCRFLNDDFEVVHQDYNYTTFAFEVEVYERFRYTDAELWLLGEYGSIFVENELADPLQVIVNTSWPTITENYQ